MCSAVELRAGVLFGYLGFRYCKNPYTSAVLRILSSIPIQHLTELPGNSYAGRNFYYGIREHAMGSILNGIAYFGLHRCSGATFLVFADYMRAPIRVAALSELPVNYILTHDSIGVGEVRRRMILSLLRRFRSRALGIGCAIMYHA